MQVIIPGAQLCKDWSVISVVEEICGAYFAYTHPKQDFHRSLGHSTATSNDNFDLRELCLGKFQLQVIQIQAITGPAQVKEVVSLPVSPDTVICPHNTSIPAKRNNPLIFFVDQRLIVYEGDLFLKNSAQQLTVIRLFLDGV